MLWILKTKCYEKKTMFKTFNVPQSLLSQSAETDSLLRVLLKEKDTKLKFPLGLCTKSKKRAFQHLHAHRIQKLQENFGQKPAQSFWASENKPNF
jgi:hypothetical protein